MIRAGAGEPREVIRAGAGGNEVIQQKIDYIHNNPVEEGIVFRPEDYKYSSAPDYAGEKGLLDNVCVFQYFKL